MIVTGQTDGDAVSRRLDRSAVVVDSLTELADCLSSTRPAAVVVCPGASDVPTAVATVREHRPDVPVLAPLSAERADLFGEATTTVPDPATPAALATATETIATTPAGLDASRTLDALNHLQATVAELLDAEDVDAVAAAAVTAAREVFELPAAGVHLLNDEGTALDPVAYSEGAAALFDGEPPSYGPDSEAWAVYRTGESLILGDTARADIESMPSRSALVLPLGEHGLFVCSSPTPREFTEVDEYVANVLARATTAALDVIAGRDRLDRREAELARERDRLSGLFQTAPIPAASVRITEDDEPIAEDVNPAFEETFGYDAADIVGENIDEYIVPDGEQDDVVGYNERIAGDESREVEVKRETTDGLRDFRLSVSPIASDVTYAFYVDVTERKQRQQRLQVLSRVLRHDIRNQMNVIEGNAGLLAERVEDPELSERAAGIRRSASKLTSLSRKTRRVERLVAREVLSAETDLVRLVSHQLSVVRDETDAVITANLPETAVVRGGDALAVVVEELLDNALEYNDADRTRIEVDVTTASDYVTVTVWDNGSGLPDEERALLRGEREQTQLEHASGIGLWMVKWVVETVGGRLVFGTAEAGTEIGFTVPRYRSADDERSVSRTGR